MAYDRLLELQMNDENYEMSYFFSQSKTFFGPDLLAIENLILQEVM